MATRAAKAEPVDWRAAFRRAAARALQVTGSVLLYAFTAFLLLALFSYEQTDPSFSTAAAGPVANWMGRAGAWAADMAYLGFGLLAYLLVPLAYVFARKLWSDAEQEETPHGFRWWRAVIMLLLGMALLGTVLALMTDAQKWDRPAGYGGLTGLLGAGAIEAVAARMPEAGRFWTILGAGLASLGIGAFLVGRVFAFDWAKLLALPQALRRMPALPRSENPFKPQKKDRPAREPRPDPTVEAAARKPPEITDPRSAPKPATPGKKGTQRDLFAAYELPSLDLLADPPPDKGKKLDKLALERNARLLETVLDDFNVKGEITAVRTGPVVTMYELEPAPGIKASRVVGLAEDIARNMSAISARVSPIPGKTVMGIELPNADRQMVSFKELAASEAFQDHKGALPIILGKDIAGEPIVADLAAMPHLLVAGTTGSGKSVGLNMHPALPALPLHARRMPADPGRSQGPRTQVLRRYPAPPLARRDRAAQVGARAQVGGRGDGEALPHDERHRRAQHRPASTSA